MEDESREFLREQLPSGGKTERRKLAKILGVGFHVIDYLVSIKVLPEPMQPIPALKLFSNDEIIGPLIKVLSEE